MTTLHVLMREIPHGDGEDIFPVGVYSTEENAKAALQAAIDVAVKTGLAVYWNPRTERANDEWDINFSIHALELDRRLFQKCNKQATTLADQEADRTPTRQR